jgi:geranylgeranyl pyrophosphate synthase
LTTLAGKIENTLKSLLQNAAELPAATDNLSSAESESILRAVLYPVEAGGKRVRPMLTCLVAQACGTPPDHPAVLNCAAALEFIHTYSLVHDDLPCMDNDDFRRGKPTAHKVFGDANALLVGDALLTHAFFAIAKSAEAGLPATAALRCVEILSRTSGVSGMIAGQWKDLAQTKTSASANWQTLRGIHNLKTGALLGAACAMGIVTGLAMRGCSTHSPENNSAVALAEKLGVSTGLAFQIVDDVLDMTQSSTTLGKTAGKDLSQEKLTAVSLLGIDAARLEAERVTQEALRTLDELEVLVVNILKQAPAGQTSRPDWSPVRSFIQQLLVRNS